MRTKDASRLARVVMVIFLVLALGAPAYPNEGQETLECSFATLNGLYLFSATGFVTPPGVAPFPKAITELLRFDGNGMVTTPAITVAVTGRPLFVLEPGASGHYTVDALVPPDRACVGTVELNDATHSTFNMIIPHGARTIALIQTNATPGNSSAVTNIFQGTATRIAH